MNEIADWIAVDWGTSNLRAWLMGKDGVIGMVTSDKGMGALERDGFEPELLRLVGDCLPERGTVPVIACGMVGARQGWHEAPYVTTPCAAPGVGQAVTPEVRDPRLKVRILPGVSQASPADVMRGEETQIAGFLAAHPEFDGVLCLPGTHTKWVHISAREIVSFRTFMTGEIFALLSGQSVLRHSVAGDGWDQAAFDEAVTDAMSAPQKFTARLFSLRAGSLLDGTEAATSRARLSGLLMGLEIAGAKEYWLGREIVLIGAPKLNALYKAALAPQGASVSETDGAEIVLAGLRAAYEESMT
ncbi:2-dehydro-3-deoxygalactonokinase [Marinovum sp. SP66]|uniref:2-dehydro-3-deoxygalactonokinase n=1 Tax=Marinovum TaxID=367771 RepID=UPI00237A2533|nr:2-dehydro-3-deoxygalactonokinase [Marinovum sp. SP66]MDD9740296.1 2-dehydro-3-deoxygalactonokinase [Marinovum sp. SP66]